MFAFALSRIWAVMMGDVLAVEVSSSSDVDAGSSNVEEPRLRPALNLH